MERNGHKFLAHVFMESLEQENEAILASPVGVGGEREKRLIDVHNVHFLVLFPETVAELLLIRCWKMWAIYCKLLPTAKADFSFF